MENKTFIGTVEQQVTTTQTDVVINAD